MGVLTTRSTEDGAADVVWTLQTDLAIAFEAKTDKKPDGELFKKNLQEAKGHLDWVKNKLGHKGPIEVVMISPTSKLDKIASPFAKDLYYMHPDDLLKIAKSVAEALKKLRLQFAGQDYAVAQVKFSADVKNLKLDLASVRKRILVSKLLKN